MARSIRLHPVLSVVAAVVLVTVACSAPSLPTPAPPSGPSAAATPGPVALYTLENPEHRNPVPIVWHAESGTFFLGTNHDGSIYRGNPDHPSVPVFLHGVPGQAATGMTVAGGRLLVAGGMYGDTRAYDLRTRERVGEFTTGAGGSLMGMHVTGAGVVWVTDAVRPMLWHLTADQIAAGSGAQAALPLEPEIPYINPCDNVEGVVALSESRLVVVNFADGALYRIDLDPQAPQGRTITPIVGAAVPLGSRMILDGKRLVVADENGLSVVELSDDAARGTVVTRMRDPAFRDTTAVARVGDRYLVVNTAWNGPAPYTISSVPVVP